MSKGLGVVRHLTDAVKTKWKGTIGIVGFQPHAVALLNKEMVKYGNATGLSDDQHFPEILAIGMECSDKRHLIDQVNLCRDFGCDAVVSPERIGQSRLDQMIKDSTGTTVKFLSGSISDLAQEAIESAFKVDNIRRPDLLFDKEVAWEGQQKRVRRNLEKDKADRNGRLEERNSFGGYPILKRKFIGVLGGSGPLASAALCEILTEKAVDYVHYSVNSAPGKHYFEMRAGPSYIQHYSNAVDFFHQVGARFLAIPCNTAHVRLSEFCGDDVSKVIDIRQAVLGQNRSVDGFILLGTNRTVGISVPQGSGLGIYEDLRSKNFSGSKPFIVPSEEQQKEVMSAIYDVKAGRMDESKDKILRVIQEIREEKNNQNLPVIFASAELPLANFTLSELACGDIINPVQSLAKAAKEVVAISERRKEELNMSSRKLSGGTNPNSKIRNRGFSTLVVQESKAQMS